MGKNSTGDGSSIQGNVDVKDGDFVGRDKITKNTIQVSISVFALVIFIIVWVMLNSSIFSLNPLPTTTATQDRFKYQVSVQTLTGEPIKGANVMIEIGNGKAPLNDVSDSNGLVRISIEKLYDGEPGRLTVKADGYKIHTQNIDLTENDLPKIIQLNSTP